MSQSTRNRARRGSGTITVIEARVHRNSARRARGAFVVTTIVTTALAMVIASQWLAPILSLLAGILAGVTCGICAWCVVRVWPIARVLWWWLPELGICSGLMYGWGLLNRLPLVAVATVTTLFLAGLLVGPVRRRVLAWVWCFVVRHRLRTCFAQFIIANQSGSLPLILAARPTPVGERVWIYLRPGLSPSDLESRLEKIAVACHASAVLIERASTRTAGLVRVDVKRREVLGALVGSPLAKSEPVDVVDSAVPVSPAPAGITLPAADPAVDLPDVTTTVATTPAPAAAATARFTPTPTPVSVPKVATTIIGGDDYADWID